MSESNGDSNSLYIPYIFLDENNITDRVLKQLFCEAKKAIICLEIYKLLEDLCEYQSNKDKDKENSSLIITEKIKNKYRDLCKVCMGIAKKIKGRVTITLPDGHVVVDTCKGEGNTYENYVEDVISENHNTRVSMFQAQHDYKGVSHERKFSSTTHQKEVYVSVRLGPFRNSAGTIRLSIPDY